MSDINYKPLIEETIEQFKSQNPDYTYGQIIYSALKSSGISGTRSEFLELSDEGFYTALDNALKSEEGEKEFFNKN